MTPAVLRHLFFAIALLLATQAGPAAAQEQDPDATPGTAAPLTVGLYLSPPFVMEDDLPPS